MKDDEGRDKWNEMGERRGAYTRREVQAKRYSTGDAALACAVGADDHVEVRAGLEFDIVVGHEVVQLDADDGTGDVAVSDGRKNIKEVYQYGYSEGYISHEKGTRNVKRR